MMRNSKIALLVLCLFVVALGCSENSGETITNVPAGRYDNLVAGGWTMFTAGNWMQALSQFQNAIDLNENDAGAYAGAGWCRLFLDQIDRALDDFRDGSRLQDPAHKNLHQLLGI